MYFAFLDQLAHRMERWAPLGLLVHALQHDLDVVCRSRIMVLWQDRKLQRARLGKLAQVMQTLTRPRHLAGKNFPHDHTEAPHVTLRRYEAGILETFGGLPSWRCQLRGRH